MKLNVLEVFDVRDMEIVTAELVYPLFKDDVLIDETGKEYSITSISWPSPRKISFQTMMLLLDKKMTGSKLRVAPNSDLTDDEQMVINTIEHIYLVENVLNYVLEIQMYLEADEISKKATQSQKIARIINEIPNVLNTYSEERTDDWLESMRDIMEDIKEISYRNRI